MSQFTLPHGRGIKRVLTNPRYVLCGALLMPFYLSPLYGTAQFQKVLLFRFLTEFAFALWLPGVILGERRIPRSPVLYVLYGYLAVATLTTATSQNPGLSLWGDWNTFPGLVDTLHVVAFTVMAASIFRGKDWPKVLMVNAGVAGAVAAIGIWEYVAGRPVVSSMLGNVAYLAAYLAMSACLSIAACGLQGVGRWRRFSLLLSAALCVGVLVLTANRGAFVALAASGLLAGILYAAWGRNRGVKVAMMGVLAAMVVLAFGLYAFRHSGAAATLSASVPVIHRFWHAAESGGLNDRLMFLRVALRAWQMHPWLGWGPDNFIGAFVAAQDTMRGSFATQAHSQPINELATKGVIGLWAYLALWGVLAWRLIAWVRHTRAGVMALGVSAAAAALFVSDLVLFDTPATLLLLALVIALSVNAEADAPPVGGVRRQPDSERPSGGAVEAFPKARLLTWTGIVLLWLVCVWQPLAASYRMMWAISNTGITWPERQQYAQQAFSTLHVPMANGARSDFFHALRLSWWRFNPQDQAAILRFASMEGEHGLAAEPENPQLWVSLTWLYRTGMLSDGEVARYMSYLGGAIQVAPQQVAALRLLRMWHGPQRSFLP